MVDNTSRVAISVAMNIPSEDTSSLSECAVDMAPNLSARFPLVCACLPPLVAGVTRRALVSWRRLDTIAQVALAVWNLTEAYVKAREQKNDTEKEQQTNEQHGQNRECRHHEQSA